MSKLRALELFEGGAQGVYQRMAQIIREGLHKKVDEIRCNFKRKDNAIRVIAKKLNIDYNRLKRIYNGESSNGDVNYSLFERLEFPLNLSIHKVLGKPIALSKREIWEKWNKECEAHPIVGAAALITHTHRGICEAAQEDESDKLEWYVTLRAIRELHISRQ